MNRLRASAVVLVVAGTALLAGASDPKPVDDKQANSAKPVTPKIAVFNMAAVMRDFNQVKHHEYLMTKRKEELSKQLVALRAEYINECSKLEGCGLSWQASEIARETRSQKLRALVRKIVEEDDRINKQLKKEADDANKDFHDRIKLVVSKVAEVNGYQLVLAYSDTGTPDDLKLKAPAVLPFYIDPTADITKVVIKTLNVWYPAIDTETQDLLDYSVNPPKRTPVSSPPLTLPFKY